MKTSLLRTVEQFYYAPIYRGNSLHTLYPYISYTKLGAVPRTKSVLALLSLVVVLVIASIWSSLFDSNRASHPSPPTEHLLKAIETLSGYLIDYPLGDAHFGEMGRRVEILGDLMKTSQVLASHLTLEQKEVITTQTESLASSLFPFLPQNQSLLLPGPQSFSSNSRGIVIPSGITTFRYACHLICSIRDVLHSTLPIQVVYAGDNDLPLPFRQTLISLGHDIETLDILSVFNDTNLEFNRNSWAIKPFAILASKFQHVLLLDADAVFLQPPETILDSHPGYQETGILLFHDRLLWKGNFPDRHDWWRQQMKHRIPSDTLSKSLVYMEDYAEEGDSGVVAVDKGRLPVVLGLLHICWQNTRSVREKWTYRITYGDKESWWFGYELSGVPYSFESHYASILGSTVNQKGNGSEVCGFTIAHVDGKDKLLWYNGSLLKNKMRNPMEFDVPTHWMMDGVWWKGSMKADMSCMSDAPLRMLDEGEMKVVEENVRVAKEVDKRLIREFPHRWGLEKEKEEEEEVEVISGGDGPL
jgi:alpha 1,3-mannosyltransferase